MFDVIKRLGDLVALILAAPLLLVVFPLVALAVLLNFGRPIFFRQKRGGLHGEAFDLFKFRSMTSETDADGNLLPDEDRLTPFGKFLRASSLDELPALINVLKGDMSIVGPRPFMYDYVALYSPEQARRHEVRPGITGWAQVNGRNALSWEEKFSYDVEYVDRRSVQFDIKILWLTVIKVVARDGINAHGEATAARFLGKMDDD